jgi:ribonucleoside-diphosphate reductase alpha chain
MSGKTSTSAQSQVAQNSVCEIPFQPASTDIWDSKYRLKTKDGQPLDKDINGTYRRVAKALAAVETSETQQKYWYKEFLWALQHGAIPAGRIISNAGALAHKPATSTINCTVSGNIHDSMDDILQKVHEAGLTLKAGCGIGYEFSTLRPKNAYVSGAGAYTSGALSFMDIYDKMCFTVSSAGGRRGAQMATFDIGHPDVIDFIRAKREDGRLRQFNLSLLITAEFMQAVKNNEQWALSFPVTEKEVERDRLDLNNPEEIIWRDLPNKADYVSNADGLVACKVYKTIPARRLWDVIMASTYDYAEPGFILIDKVNEMNNNWFCEDIRATNPCVTADTWVQTSQGAKQVAQLIGQQIEVIVDGKPYLSGKQGFFKTAIKNVVKLNTQEGYSLRLTCDHKVRKITTKTRFKQETVWCNAADLQTGDQILLHNHRAYTHWQGDYSHHQGYLIGLLIGDGTLKEDKAVLSVWKNAKVANSDCQAIDASCLAIMDKVLKATTEFTVRCDFKGWIEIAGRNELRLSFAGLKTFAEELGMSSGNKAITPAIESASSDFYKGFLQGFFDADGSVQGTQEKGISIRLSQSDLPRLEAVQRMLLRLGIYSTLYRNRRPAGIKSLPNGKGGYADYEIKPQHELVISGDNVAIFQTEINFTHVEKAHTLKNALANYKRRLNREWFIATVVSTNDDGVEEVFDIQVPGVNTFDANGFHAHNCGEQPLPEYGSCLLGSINLTKFVQNPFTEHAYFDWESYQKTIRIFTRMLDNVVEINGLPLEKQRHEILTKRRHGMGYLGLGSTLTLLGMRYGAAESLNFTEEVTKVLAVEGWKVGLELAKEKGVAPVLTQEFEVSGEMLHKRPEMVSDGYKIGDKITGKVLHAKYSRYMQKLAQVEPELVKQLAETGARFTHHSSIAPTGTISLSLANNASNGIEPSFAHHYSRNIIKEGKKSKEKIDVYSFELLAYRHLINSEAMPYSENPKHKLPDYFISADEVSPKQHVDIQAAAQKWIDSSISKTANVPTDFAYDDFKHIYQYAYEQGLKGCTTFRFNPEVFQGVLVKESDLENTLYQFTLEDGSVVEFKGNEEIEYDGEIHTAANLFDALKEGYYGKF